MADTPPISPGWDLSIAVGPFETINAQGQKAPITTGTISGFVSAIATPDATAAHANFVIAALTYVGGQPNPLGGTFALGWWLAQLDGSLITDALCELHFASTGEAYLHVISANNSRPPIRLEYQRTRWAVMA